MLTHNYRKAQLELHAALLLIGFTGLFGKLISAGPVTIAFGRTAISAAAIIFCLTMLRNGTGILDGLKTATAPWVVLSGVLLTLHWLAFFHAIQISSVAVGLIGFAAFPVFVTLAEPILHGRSLRIFDCFTTGLVIIGLLLVAPSADPSSPVTQGLLWAVLAGFIYALLTLLNQQLVRNQSAIHIALWQQVCVTLLLLPVMLRGDKWPNTVEWSWLLVLALGCTALPQILLIRALQFVRAQMVSIATAMEPVYGIIFAAIFLGEIPAPRTVVGGGVILGAVLLATRGHRQAIAPTTP